jgi:hypothetical protein
MQKSIFAQSLVQYLHAYATAAIFLLPDKHRANIKKQWVTQNRKISN